MHITTKPLKFISAAFSMSWSFLKTHQESDTWSRNQDNNEAIFYRRQIEQMRWRTVPAINRTTLRYQPGY
jgi:hypothetical protein